MTIQKRRDVKVINKRQITSLYNDLSSCSLYCNRRSFKLQRMSILHIHIYVYIYVPVTVVQDLLYSLLN
jgi:hypothetical protein